MRKVDVFVKGPGSGRETAIRSLTAAGLEVGAIQRRHARAAQRLSARPSAAASDPAETTKETRTWLVTPAPITKKSRSPQGRPRRRRPRPIERPPLPARPARPCADEGEASTCSSCRRSRRPASSTASWRSSSAATTRRRASRPGKTGENLLQHPRVPAGQRRLPRRPRPHPSHGPPARDARPLPGQRPQGRRPVLPRRAERHHHGPQAVASRCFPFVLARADVRRAHRPGLAQVVPSTLQILVHALPVRAQIDTQAHRAADRRALLQELTARRTCRSAVPARGRPGASGPVADRAERPAGHRPAASRGVI